MHTIKQTLAVLVFLASGCGASHGTGDDACLPGVWLRPAQTCECGLISTPECTEPTCVQTNTAMALRVDGSYMEFMLRYTTASAATLSIPGTPSRGTWATDQGQMSRHLGATTTTQPVTCDSSHLRWGTAEFERADSGLREVILQQWNASTVVAVSYSPSN